MRRILARFAMAVGLAIALVAPNLPGVAQAIPAITETQCAPALRIAGSTVASCGQSRGTEGRHGTYDQARGTYTWGSWRPRYLEPVPQGRVTVRATDGFVGRFIGFPPLMDDSGIVYTRGTQYREVAEPTFHYEGRRGVLKAGVFTPVEGWYRANCIPSDKCGEWQYEPLPPTS